MIVISTYDKELLNAGPKAKMDIESALKENYDAKIISLFFKTNGSFFNSIKNRIEKYIACRRLNKSSELVIIQFPFDGNINNTKFIKNKIGIVHDIQELRYQSPNQKEINSLNSCKYIISHNKRMTNYLISRGIDKDKIINLDLFDYLSNDDIEEDYSVDLNDLKIVYAGNLAKEKSPFLYQIESVLNYKLYVYGVGYNLTEDNNIIYCGKFNPSEVNSIQGDIGLVWDGVKDESDANDIFKNYTKYNNPHKLSCYIARGIPVIVWRKSAISDFVERNNIGYLINSIQDINNIDFSDYNTKRKNAIRLGKQVRNGYYIKKALNSILDQETD
jgi:hypothetical protein